MTEAKDSSNSRHQGPFTAVSNFYFYQFTKLPKLVSDRLFVALIGKSHGRMERQDFVSCFKMFGKGRVKKALATLFLMLDFDYDGFVGREDARALLLHFPIFSGNSRAG